MLLCSAPPLHGQGARTNFKLYDLTLRFMADTTVLPPSIFADADASTVYIYVYATPLVYPSPCIAQL